MQLLGSTNLQDITKCLDVQRQPITWKHVQSEASKLKRPERWNPDELDFLFAAPSLDLENENIPVFFINALKHAEHVIKLKKMIFRYKSSKNVFTSDMRILKCFLKIFLSHPECFNRNHFFFVPARYD